jgi:hypothetical protein
MRSWLIVITIVALMLVWFAIAYHTVGTSRVHWDYGSTPYIPADSYSSTQAVKVGQPEAPPQVPPIPPAPTPTATPSPTKEPAR